MKRRGFTLIELMIAITVMALLSTALTRMMLSDSRFVSRQEALLTARQTARAAANVLSVELRMVSDSGLLVASPDSLVVRVPYAFGVGCDVDGTATGRVAVLMPADSLMYAEAVPWGAARRTGSGDYQFATGITVLASTDSTRCLSRGIRPVPGGRLINVQPPTALSEGAIFYLYQRITYRFRPSTELPGRTGLWRRVGAAAYEELIAPFDSSARFRFLLDPDLTDSDTPPMDLTTVAGIELKLVAESISPPQGEPDYLTFDLPVQVAFQNRSD